jgi:hypothetical protein
MADVRDENPGPGPKRISFDDRLSGFWQGLVLGLIFGAIGIFYDGHPLRALICVPIVGLINGAVGFLGGPKLLETLSVLGWF